MKPPHGSSRDHGAFKGPFLHDDGDVLSMADLHGQVDLADSLESTESMLQQQAHQLQQPQQERKVDADFNNQFPDDFDEDDVRRPANWTELRN
jgi:hypothetical protein